ncbi:hypothetical protein OsccyDRAFT_4116 [Leptolyngbyaceae cyanobacterium JSC-12]|nr:hypothetical protein OsccyDRAFT_4116 [Leptolyngbyaceae cyanobacterium JSC-12]
MAESSQLKNTDSQEPFQPLQIVCLEHGSSRLYAEVIQTVTNRQICWVRPLALIQTTAFPPFVESFSDSNQIRDLRQGADLLLPIRLFRVAIDTEVIPILGTLGAPGISETRQSSTSLHLNRFIKQICLEHSDLISSESVWLKTCEVSHDS